MDIVNYQLQNADLLPRTFDLKFYIMRHKLFLFAALVFMAASCAKTELLVEQSDTRTLTLTAAMPSTESQTRVALGKDPDNKNIVVRWRTGDKVLLFFQKPDGSVVAGDEPTITIVPDTDSKKATFDVILPAGVTAPCTVYLVHGATAATDGSKIEVDVSPVGFKKLDELVTPLTGKVEVVSGSSVGAIPLHHLGALQCLTLVNYWENAFTATLELSYTAGDEWFYKAGSKYDLISESVTNIGSGTTPWQEVSVPATQAVLFAQWVMPNGNIPPVIGLKAGSLVSSNQKSARSAGLERGRAYHLYGSANYYHTGLKFAEPLVWAGSNIYWDGTQLTFDETVVDAGAGSDLKQGVFFKWGSLVGVSPSLSYVTYTPIYVMGGASSWISGTTPYNSILDFYGANISGGGQTNTYLNDTQQNTDFMYLTSRGDICKYLSKTGAVEGNWRMPTGADFNAAGIAEHAMVGWSTNSLPWSRFGTFATVSGAEADGTTLVGSGGTYTVGHAVSRFPASGYRDHNGMLLSIGTYGNNWSSSIFTGTDMAFHMVFVFSGFYPVYYFNRRYGFPVRCVRE